MPLPLPLAPELMATQLAPRVAVQLQPLVVVTALDLVASLAGIDCVVGDTEMVKVWPATEVVAPRVVGAKFAETE